MVSPGGIGAVGDLEEDRRLATQGGSARRRQCQGRLATRRCPLGGGGAVRILQARGAWRCVMRAKRFWSSDGARGKFSTPL